MANQFTKPVDDDRLPWERQWQESRQAFAAFSYFLAMDPPTRSVTAAYRQYVSKPNARQPNGTWNHWRGTWRWESRADAYDAAQERARLDARRADAFAEAAAHRAEIVRMAERHAQVAAVFIGKIVQRLNKLEPEELSPTAMHRWLDVAVKVERLSRGEPTEIGQTVAEGTNLTDLTKNILEDPHACDLAIKLLDQIAGVGSHASRPGDPRDEWPVDISAPSGTPQP